MKRLTSFKKPKPKPVTPADNPPSDHRHNNNNTNNNTNIYPQSVHETFDDWANNSTSSALSATTASEDAEYQEPKQTIRMGVRRGTIANIDKISQQMKDLHVKSGSHQVIVKGKHELEQIPEDARNNGSNQQPNHAKQQPLRPQTSSLSNNVMANIYSSPLPEFDITYTPPVFPKSEADAEFISIALQRNFVFANALSDDDVTRKREIKQVVDAFELHKVRYHGEVILSHKEVGEYFFIVKEGSVRYYQNYKPNGVAKDAMGTGKLISLANKPGQSFGELCLLYDCPPPADCVSGEKGDAEVPCKDGACLLWRIHRETFRKILALRTMRRDKKLREALEKVPCLRELDAEYLKRIGDALNPRSVEAGGVLYREGDVADTLYLIGTEGKVQLTRGDGRQHIVGPYQSFGDDAISYTLTGQMNGEFKKKSTREMSSPPRRCESARALERTVILSMSASQFARVVGSLEDAILLSRDRRLLRSVPLFRDSDIEDFEYELLTALIETVHLKLDKEIFVEGDNIDEPALYIVRSGEVEVISEAFPRLNRVVRAGEFFGEDTLTPDENLKFGGAKGGNKYSDESCDVISDTAVLGKLTLANIDSVIQDLHRLGCKRKKHYTRRGSVSEQDIEGVETLDDLEFHHLFGAGTFGRVWIVSPLGKRVPYALKIQSKRELLDQRQAGGAQRERSVMVRLDHPFVCKLINTFQDEACIYMLIQFVQGGELLNLIQGGDIYGGLPESAAKFFAAVMLEGLTHMHQRQIVYRDLKPENVLIDKDGYPVIIDFGFSKICTDKTYTFCGTPLYLAPEIILSRGHDRGVDYWALGCLVYEMIFGFTPFYVSGIDQKGLFKRIVRGKWSIPNEHNKVTRSAIEFIWGLLQRRPSERLGCLAGGYRDIKRHAWFQEVNFGKLIKKQIQAPWVPEVSDPLDTSNFESLDDAEDEDFLKGKAPLTAKEQIVFRDF
ncbi:hypothetical protein ACHAWX_002850 [Stephanocyclus meneghinianus]